MADGLPKGSPWEALSMGLSQNATSWYNEFYSTAYMHTQANAVILKPKREVHAKNRHPWVFLGAVQSFPEFENGSLLPVVAHTGELMGYGYFNQGQSIVGRMVSFAEGDPKAAIEASITNALALRHTIAPANTNAYRLINGEGDNLPGLIVDKYGDILVIQINTLGIERLKPLILETLIAAEQPRAVYEKSNSPTRSKEGLTDTSTWVHGQAEEPAQIVEHGNKFYVHFSTGQKTGFFLDQREMRQLVKSLAKDKTLLNCFGYTGGFSTYALAGGAKRADTLDMDARAIETAKENIALNGFSTADNAFYCEDVFRFLDAQALPQKYDFIILDPPAFAKRASDVANATRGYRDINRMAMQHLPKGGLLLTSSCSQHIDSALFQTIIFQAAKDAKRNVKILSYHILAADHPINLYFPEGDYLKSLLLYVE